MSGLKRSASDVYPEEDEDKRIATGHGLVGLEVDISNVGDMYEEDDDEELSDDADSDEQQATYKPRSATIRLGSVTAGPLNLLTGQRGALPIAAQSTSAVALNYEEESSALPEDAVSYLLSVRREADSRPSFVRASRPQRSQPTSQAQPSEPCDSQSILRDVAVSKKWHEYTMKQYKISRSVFTSSCASQSPSLTRSELPSSLSSWREFIQSPEHPPSMKTLSILEQEDVFRLFKYYQRWITGSMSLEMSNWLYALLVRVADIVPAHEISILRQLCQKCMSVKQTSVRNVRVRH
ncbi:uncharacterized protein V2V93DRAFT_362829, partial [Kockiozyma suomiensis]|uniref:uncharacterized protein n=1 Tax=Kockiozyma suomiensis TaxID=1337062 RepID=UPI003344166D